MKNITLLLLLLVLGVKEQSSAEAITVSDSKDAFKSLEAAKAA